MKAKYVLLCLLSTFLFPITLSAQQKVQVELTDGTPSHGEEGLQNVADGKYYTKWCYDSPQKLPYYVVLSAQEAFSLKQYGYVSGEDTNSYIDRNPLAWKVYGSNDKQNWTLLDEKKNDWTMDDQNEQEFLFKINPKDNYKHYKFEFIRMQGSTRIQLAEINLYQ